jgi:type I restriction enzyme S subunit
MEVTPGYKQTEVGMIPEDWDAGGLGRFWSVTDCKHVTAQFVADGFPIASIREVQSRFVDLSNANRTTQRFYALLTEGGRMPRVGDLILSRNATVGEVAQVAEWHPPFAMGQDVCLLRKKSPNLSTNYLQAVFRSSIIANQLSDLMVGSTFKRANIEQIRNFVVPMPPPSEQKAIAEALCDADALIESLEQLIAKKRLLKQGVMQELLTGKKRLPGFSGEWEAKTLVEIGESLIGLTYKPSDVKSDGLLVLRSSNVFEGALRFEDNVYVDMNVPERIIVRNGDILICVRNGSRDLIGKCARIDEQAEGMTFGAFMAVFRTPFHNFVYHQFQSAVIKRQIHEHLGATINQITNKSLNSFQIPFPTDDEEKTAIAGILSDMDAEIAALETKLAKARQIKQGMMHNLLTGRIRLV